MIHPSFSSILNPKSSKSSPIKPTSSKTKTTQKPKSHKSKSYYSSNFNMQKLYLDDLGNTSTNVASDAATLSFGAQIEATEQNPSQTPNVEKGEIGVESEKVNSTVPKLLVMMGLMKIS
jgi:hypothetical protein